MKIAIVTGISGQDGAYLSQLLLSKGYKVIGLIRSSGSNNLFKLTYLGIAEQVELLECDLLDLSQVIKILDTIKPDEVYNLAAQSSVSLSFQQPIGTVQFNINSVINLLEAIRLVIPSARFYQASSSEMFGKIEELPIKEDSKFHPLSPYAISKIAAHHITIQYRESYGIFASCGILFNHESYLRSDNFFTKKLIRGALDIVNGQKQFLEFGNLDVKRDFGFSKNYVEAMWLMMQASQPDDFIICSGKSIYLKEIVEYVFEKMQIPLSKMRINQKLFRPAEIEDIYGSSEKARKVLNWDYQVDFRDVLDLLIEEEKQQYGK